MTQPPPPGAYTVQQPPMSPADEKLWATLIHLGGIFFYWLAPLIGYLLLKDRGPFIRWHARQALNFQITIVIAYVVGYILTFVIVGAFVLLAAAVVAIVFSIMAAVAANRGEFYRYPVAIEFVK
jgi:uncharacterized Tic20 family protein